jgi:hypothetical protein
MLVFSRRFLYGVLIALFDARLVGAIGPPPSGSRGQIPIHSTHHEQSGQGRDVSRSLSFSEIHSN